MLCLRNRFVVFRAILGFCMEGYRSFIGHDVAKLSCIATFLHSLFRITEKLLFSALCSDQSERQDADMPFPRGEGVSGVVYEQMSAFSHSQPSPQPLSQRERGLAVELSTAPWLPAKKNRSSGRFFMYSERRGQGDYSPPWRKARICLRSRLSGWRSGYCTSSRAARCCACSSLRRAMLSAVSW